MPVEITKNYKRVRQFDPKKCVKGSFRVKTLKGGKKLVICCPKRKGVKTWNGKTCKIGTRAQSILTPRKK